MGQLSLHTYIFFLSSFLVTVSIQAQTQDIFESLRKQAELGKTYFIGLANANSEKSYDLNEGYYLKFVPAKYETTQDSILVSPALNGNFDTTNYFMSTEILTLREPVSEWRPADVSEICRQDEEPKHKVAACLVKLAPEYKVVNTRFYPFKDILDTNRTDHVIPAVYELVERQTLKQKSRIEIIPESAGRPSLKAGEKLRYLPPGQWQSWQEVVCPFGVFNAPTAYEIQEALRKLGYKLPKTGDYDEATRRFLRQFQKDYGINPEEGELSQATIDKLGLERRPLISVDY